MAVNNPYNEYLRNKVMTATPGELTLMLYEGAVKFGNIAIEAIEAKDLEKAHTNIVKVQKIVDEFRRTLDFKYPVAQHFENVYRYLSKRLVEANVKKDKEIMEECVKHLRSMRDNWKEVMKKAAMEKAEHKKG